MWQTVKRYNEEGLAGLRDRRHSVRRGRTRCNPGAPTLLSDADMSLLAQNTRKDYAKGKAWNGKKAVVWLKNELGKKVHERRDFEYLAAVGFSF